MSLVCVEVTKIPTSTSYSTDMIEVLYSTSSLNHCNDPNTISSDTETDTGINEEFTQATKGRAGI